MIFRGLLGEPFGEERVAREEPMARLEGEMVGSIVGDNGNVQVWPSGSGTVRLGGSKMDLRADR